MCTACAVLGYLAFITGPPCGRCGCIRFAPGEMFCAMCQSRVLRVMRISSHDYEQLTRIPRRCPMCQARAWCVVRFDDGIHLVGCYMCTWILKHKQQ